MIVSGRSTSTLGELRRSPDPPLIDALDDKEVKVKKRALVALWQFGPQAKQAVPKLLQIFRNTKVEESDRAYALDVLEQIGPDPQVAIPDLLEVLKTKTEPPRLRRHTALILGMMGKNHKEVVPALLQSLMDQDVQDSAALSLAFLGKEASSAVPVLVNILKNNKNKNLNTDFRIGAVEGLELFGPKAKMAIPFLFDIAKDEKENSRFRCQAISALQAIGSDARPTLLKLRQLKSTGDFDRRVGLYLDGLLNGTQENQ